ncbi:hypothetical protein R3W88_001259 [Solanum pinnatisectum]|uniref:Uncharacterized protein n=1 Tax=Solanum pinnatisectum TaxID=50273 RepID=A0AAV9MLG9_9SOLN|nr:hypothetical protein R3W88_001259 [Solanum pinnatisectum]
MDNNFLSVERLADEIVGEEMKEERVVIDTKNPQEAEMDTKNPLLLLHLVPHHLTMVFFVSSPTFSTKDVRFKQPSHSFPLLPVTNFNALSLRVENHEEEIIRKSKA